MTRFIKFDTVSRTFSMEMKALSKRCEPKHFPDKNTLRFLITWVPLEVGSDFYPIRFSQFSFFIFLSFLILILFLVIHNDILRKFLCSTSNGEKLLSHSYFCQMHCSRIYSSFLLVFVHLFTGIFPTFVVFLFSPNIMKVWNNLSYTALCSKRINFR